MPEDQADPAERRPEKGVGYSRTERGRKPPLENLGPRTRFSLWYYLSLLLGFFLLQSLFFSGSDAKENVGGGDTTIRSVKRPALAQSLPSATRLLA